MPMNIPQGYPGSFHFGYQTVASCRTGFVKHLVDGVDEGNYPQEPLITTNLKKTRK